VPPRRDPQALFAPQTLDFLAVEVVSLPGEDGVGPAIAPAGMVTSEVTQATPEVLVGIGIEWPVAMGRTMLADDVARPPLR
jgi:hypothetical protein